MKVDIIHVAVEIDFKTSDHIVTMEEVAERCISTKGNSFQVGACTFGGVIVHMDVAAYLDTDTAK